MTDISTIFGPELVEAIEQLVDKRVEAALREHAADRQRRFVTVPEAAKVTGLTERAIRAQVRKGRIASKPLGTRIFVDLGDLG